MPDEKPDAAAAADAADADDLIQAPAPEPEAAATTSADYRRTYLTRYAEMTPEERAKLAAEGDAATMRALCHDPLPRVITALMENPNFSVNEARIIAREHGTGVGLGLLAHNARMIADPEVRRRMIRNPHVSAQVVATLLRGKPLQAVYQVSISHDVPENSRSFARSELRRAFSERSPDEKAALIIKTEGRVLSLIVGVALDGRTIAILIGRSAMSAMLIRNLAQWPTTPPPVLGHLLKMPQVQRDKSLSQALQRHPNLPSSLKPRG